MVETLQEADTLTDVYAMNPVFYPLAFLLLTLSQCTTVEACTEIGCDRSGLFICIRPTHEHDLAQGEYHIRVVADEVQILGQCDPTDIDGCDISTSGPSKISATWLESERCPIEDPQNRRGLTLSLSQDGYPHDEIISTGPESVDLTIELNGETIDNTSLSPRYTRDAPNGDNCPYCETAATVVGIPQQR